MRGCLIVVAVGCNFSAGQVHDAPSEGASDANIVFVTSASIAPGAIGGLEQADAFCQMSATTAGLAGTYLAWLSSTTADAGDRLRAHAASGWVRPDGQPVVGAVDDLVVGRLLYPPRLDETGVDDAQGAFEVATGTDASGKRTGETCSDYTQQAGTITVGHADGTTDRWTNTETLDCAKPAHLYCFGVDRSSLVTAAPAAGRRAFVTDTTLALGAGVAQADDVCQSEAAQAGLTGTFRAALATQNESASARVGLGPWVRLDGVAIGKLDAPSAPLNLTATRQYVSRSVWTGAPSPDQVGSDTTTCQDWISTNLTGVAGDVARSNSVAFFAGTAQCSNMFGVYCLEQ